MKFNERLKFIPAITRMFQKLSSQWWFLSNPHRFNLNSKPIPIIWN